MTKLRVSFDPNSGFGELVWNNKFYRDFILDLLQSQYLEVYLVTTDSSDIDSIKEILNIDDSRVYIETDTTIINKLSDLGVRIFLTGDQQIYNNIEDDLELSILPGNVNGCQPVLVNNLVDTYTLRPQYIVKFKFWLD